MFCPHCPDKTPEHPFIERYLNETVRLILQLLQRSLPLSLYHGLAEGIWCALLHVLIFVRIIKLESDPPKAAFLNRSWIFFEEGKRRGLDIFALRFFGNFIDDFFIRINGRGYFYNCTPLHLFPQSHWIDHKPTCKQFFAAQNFPHAEGATFWSAKAGFTYGQRLGFPLVVKPANGSLSAHVTYPIQDSATLRQAIQIAQKFQPRFIVERWIKGELYRVSVLGQERLFVCRKEAPHVIGDGQRTIEELIQQKNAEPERRDELNTTLHPILRSEALMTTLKKADYNLDSILTINQRLTLHNKAILSAGCDIIDCTDEIHPETRALFLRMAQSLIGDIVGIDYITPDISASYTTHTSTILELNSRPYLDMHQYPSTGKARPVAQTAWDIVLAKL